MKRGVLLVTVLLCCIFCGTQVSLAQTSTLLITEVYPAPAQGESEWVELYNRGEAVATLSGWLLMDQISSPSVIHTFDAFEVEAGQVVVIELVTQKLNNSGDSVLLVNDQNQTVDQLSYTGSTVGQSWHRDPTSNTLFAGPSSRLVVTYEPTPTPTPINTPTPSPTITPNPSPTPTTVPRVDLNTKVGTGSGITTSGQQAISGSILGDQNPTNVLEQVFQLPQSVKLQPFVIGPTASSSAFDTAVTQIQPQTRQFTVPIIGIMACVLAISSLATAIYGQYKFIH